MTYMIYKNIGEGEFLASKRKLDDIEAISSPIMQKHEFYLNKRDYDEILALDYIYQNDFFMGNIGVAYHEVLTSNMELEFKFYILKAFDLNHKRYFKKIELEKSYSLEEIETEIISLFEKCIYVYNDLRKRGFNRNH